MSKFQSAVLLLFLFLTPFVTAQESDNSKISPACVDAAYMLEFFALGGVPVNGDQSSEVTILVNHAYAVGYSLERRNPLWAAYCASSYKKNPAQPSDRPMHFERSNFFFPDRRTDVNIDGRTFGGGMDRGHMVPNYAIAYQYGALAQTETFLMSNICPQSSALNQNAWQKLEKWIIDEAQSREHLFVLCGPIFGDVPNTTTNGPERGIQVPVAFYLILVDTSAEHHEEPTFKTLSYIFPQDTDPGANFKDREQFGASIGQIEQRTGLQFFPRFDTKFSFWPGKEAVTESHW